jgi:hypothetical protein
MKIILKKIIGILYLFNHLPKSFILIIIGIIYVSFCLFFSYERSLNTDCSYQLFNIINKKSFFFQEYRYGVFLTQIPLIIGIFLKLPIILLLNIYTLSFPILYAIICWICYRFFKSKEAALAIALSMITGVGATYFHFITETHLLIVISCLTYAILQNNITYRKLWYFPFLLFSSIAWAFITHPNALFTIVFVVGLIFVQKRISFYKSFIILIFIGVLMFFKIILTPKGSYDSNQYTELLLFNEKISHLFSFYSFTFIKARLSHLYLPVLIMFIMTFLFYKRKWEVLFTLFSFSFYMLLSIITFSKGDSDAMMEKSFMPGIFMIVLLFSVFIYSAKLFSFANILIVTLTIISFVGINKASRPYSLRIELLTSIVSQTDSLYPKIIASFSDYNEGILKYCEWATSIDTLFLSLCISDKPKTLFIVNNKEDYINDIKNKNIFMYLPWKQIQLNELNANYFMFPDEPYRLKSNK